MFLDYDGTLAPIVEDPAKAFCPPETLETLAKIQKASLAKTANIQLAFVSGRAVSKVKAFVSSALGPSSFDGALFCGSHGFDITGLGLEHVAIRDEHKKVLQLAKEELEKRLSAIPGATLEDNVFSLSAHYRNVSPAERQAEVEKAVEDVLSLPFASSLLTKKPGKMVWELRPNIDWNKGAAVEWALNHLLFPAVATSSSSSAAGPAAIVLIGDDATDEDMMERGLRMQDELTACREIEQKAKELEQRIAKLEEEGGGGVSSSSVAGPVTPDVLCLPIIVAAPAAEQQDGANPASACALMPRATHAKAYIRSPEEVRAFLESVLVMATAPAGRGH